MFTFSPSPKNMSETPQRQPESAAQKPEADSANPDESKEQQNQVNFATLMFATKIEAMARMAAAGQRVLDNTSEALPKFNVGNPNSHTIEELQQFMKQTKNSVAVATVTRAMIEHPNGAKALDSVKPMLDSNDLCIYSAALAYMMTYGDAEDLPVYLKNADDLLAATTQLEKKLVTEYEKKVAESIERSKKTGRGSRAFLLFDDLDRQHQSPELFSRYSSLVQGYGTAQRRGQDTLPQLKKLHETSNNDTALVMTGSQLVESGKFDEIKNMILTGKEKVKKDALLLSMFIALNLNPDKDKARQAERVRQISTLSKELLAGDTPFDETQEQFLKRMSVEQKK